MQARFERVKCNQTGKHYNVKVAVLSTEDGDPLQKMDPIEGAQMMMSHNQKVYPVTFVAIINPLGSHTVIKCAM